MPRQTSPALKPFRHVTTRQIKMRPVCFSFRSCAAYMAWLVFFVPGIPVSRCCSLRSSSRSVCLTPCAPLPALRPSIPHRNTTHPAIPCALALSRSAPPPSFTEEGKELGAVEPPFCSSGEWKLHAGLISSFTSCPGILRGKRTGGGWVGGLRNRHTYWYRTLLPAPPATSGHRFNPPCLEKLPPVTRWAARAFRAQWSNWRGIPFREGVWLGSADRRLRFWGMKMAVSRIMRSRPY